MQALIGYTKIRVSNTILNNAYCYLDIRNLIIHNHGFIDQKFIDNYRNRFPHWRLGGKIERSYQLYCDMFNAINVLCQKIDQALINNGFVTPIH